jgi:hypothetical protein
VASTERGRDLTEQHRLEQQQVRSSFLLEFLALWRLLDSTRLDATSPGWVQAVLRLVQLYRMRSAEVATVYYEQYADVEAPPVPAGELERARIELPTGVRRPPRHVPAARPTPTPRSTPEPARRQPRTAEPERAPEMQRDRRDRRVRLDIDESVFRRVERRTTIDIPDIDWKPADRAVVVSMNVLGPVAQKQKAARGKPLQTARDESFTQAVGAATRHVLTGGRQSLLTLLDDDPVALGWIRVTDGDPCAFCAILASRGPVYRSRESAGFLAHDHCACTPEPVYSRDTLWPGRAKEFRGLWRTSTEGLSGKDARNAFRREYEARQREARRNVA